MIKEAIERVASDLRYLHRRLRNFWWKCAANSTEIKETLVEAGLFTTIFVLLLFLIGAI